MSALPNPDQGTDQDTVFQETVPQDTATSPAVRQSAAEVVVSVGTDHHRFDRLIKWMDEWRDRRPDVVVVVQAGTSNPSRHGDSRELIPHGDLLNMFQHATAVVSHGGPSTVMDARMSGRLPIVVPRNPAYGEHVDEHQMRFAEHLDRHSVAVVIHERDALFAAIDKALAQPQAFTVAVETQTAPGVAEFGAAVEQLLEPSLSAADVGPEAPPASKSLEEPFMHEPDRRRTTT